MIIKLDHVPEHFIRNDTW